MAGAWGGSGSLLLHTHRLRANRGDAERYIWERLRALALSAPGTLAVEDEFGRRTTRGPCRCTRASGRVRGHRLAELTYRFLAPDSTAPDWPAPPAAPPEYDGTDTLLDYAVDGVPLGDHGGGLRFQMSRRCSVRGVPRTRGGRVGTPPRAALLRLIVTAWLHRAAQNPTEALGELLRAIGTAPVSLQANGNAYADLRLERCVPRRQGLSDIEFDCTFLQEIIP
jgi:hypothetical protein